MTITEQKAFLRSYTGQAQAPADFAQRWQETAAALHPAVSCAPVACGNPCGVYERLTVTFDGRSVTARVAPEAEPFREDWKVQPAQAAFRQRYLDALAVAKAALALPWVDTGRVYTFGEGFGGGLALLAASLCPAVSRCAALNPLPGDFAGLGLPGYDELDAANFAPLCRAEVLLGTCLMDEYAPPKGQAAIYNRLTCPKQWKLYPKYVHERVNFFENQMLCFFKDGIPEA